MPNQSTLANEESLDEEMQDDLLVGALAISKEMNWKSKDGSWNLRRVYHCAETGALPIHRVKGLGLVARRSALRAFFNALDEQFMNKLDVGARNR